MAFQYGEEQVGYAKAESTFGTPDGTPAATDAFRVTDFTVTPQFDRPEVPETRDTRSLQERVAGRESVSWSLSSVLRPSGTAGTPPDNHLLWKHAFGTYANTASTSDAYTLLKDPSGLYLTLYRLLEGIMEGVRGAVVQNVTINFSGDSFATVTFSGIGKAAIYAGTDTTNGTGSGDTTLTVDDGSKFSAYGVVDIDGDGNAVQITAVSGNDLTIASDTWGDGEVVAPYLPSATLAGDPLYGTKGSLSFDGGSSTISVIGGSISMNTGIGLYARSFGQSTAEDVTLPERRSVTGNLNFLVDDTTNFGILRGDAASGTAQNLRLDVGTESGSICRIAAPKVELDSAPMSGGSGLIEMNVSFTGLTSTTSAAEDELSVTFL